MDIERRQMHLKNTFITLGLWLVLIPVSLSHAQEGFYSLGDEHLDFRVVSQATGEVPGDDWEEMFDLAGKRLLISKTSILSAEDIEGVMVSKMLAGELGDYYVSVFFRKESWDKVRERTKELVQRKLAVVRRGRIFAAPIVLEPISKEAHLSVGSRGKKVVEQFIEGFIQTDEPSKEKREQEYLNWLEQKAEKSLLAESELLGLAMKYLTRGLSGEEKYYSKAVPLLKKILQKDPSRTDILLSLAAAYKGSGEQEKAIETYKKALQAYPQAEWGIRFQLAEIYQARGENARALQELKNSLKLFKAMTLSPETEKSRAKTIKMLEERIEKIKKDIK